MHNLQKLFSLTHYDLILSVYQADVRLQVMAQHLNVHVHMCLSVKIQI